MKGFTLAVSILSATLTGCAAMFHGTTEQAYIRSNVPGTEFYLNETHIGKDNAVTTFDKNMSYVIAARKAGCTETVIPVSKSFDAVTLLGLFVDFGIISILMVDGLGTGAWQQFDQTSYVLDPRCA